MSKFDWVQRGSSYYYYIVQTGKIIGTVSKIMSNDIWIGLVYTGKYTFTLDDECHLGQYVDVSFAKEAVAHFWDVQDRTLIEG